MLMTPKEYLQQAKALLTTESWIKGSYFDAIDGRQMYCAMGAMQEVASRNEVPMRIQNIAEDFLHDLAVERDILYTSYSGANVKMPATGIESFNDAESTTLEDVHSLFDAAIALADKTGIE
jgi:hypothetical protein